MHGSSLLRRSRIGRIPLSDATQVERVLAGSRVLIAISWLLAFSFVRARAAQHFAQTIALLIGYLSYAGGILAVLQLRRNGPGARAAWVLYACDVGWVMAITLVTDGPVTQYDGLIVITALSAARIGCLMEQRDQLRAEGGAVAGILQKIQPEADVRDAVRLALIEVLDLFAARTILLIAHDRPNDRLHLWTAQRAQAPVVTYAELEPDDDGDTYLFLAPAEPWYAVERTRSGDPRFDMRALERDGRLRVVTPSLPERFLAAHPFRSMLVVSTSFGEQWADRLFVLDSDPGARPLRVLESIALQVNPVIHGLDVLGHLRSRVGAAERARVARELHDGVIQSLIGLEMQVEVWRRNAGPQDAAADVRLSHVQQVLRREILDVRDLMQQLKPPSIDDTQILEYLADLVEQFQRQSGIVSQFVSEIDELPLSPQVCGEIARIVQEALVNVRKHSGARHVIVRVTAPAGYWKFEIDDDGRGFGFAGRYAHADLEIGRKGPVVIRERVRAIGGTLALESAPGQGARVEIWLPRGVHG